MHPGAIENWWHLSLGTRTKNSIFECISFCCPCVLLDCGLNKNHQCNIRKLLMETVIWIALHSIWLCNWAIGLTFWSVLPASHRNLIEMTIFIKLFYKSLLDSLILYAAKRCLLQTLSTFSFTTRRSLEDSVLWHAPNVYVTFMLSFFYRVNNLILLKVADRSLFNIRLSLVIENKKGR